MSKIRAYEVFRNPLKKNLLNTIKQRKGKAYFREGSFSDEIIWQGRKFLFPSPKKRIAKGMWVFRSVIIDVQTYVMHNRIKTIERLPVNKWNEKARSFRGKITATDVDHAYWRVAYLDGIITKSTYLKGLEIKDKSLRLAALANLSSSKEYKVIEDGVITKKTIVLKFNPIFQKVYNNIRYTCYEHMNNIAKMLGDDFICYKTDCIYYKDTEENRLMVQTYLDSALFDWKQLVEPEKPKKDKNEETDRYVQAVD